MVSFETLTEDGIMSYLQELFDSCERRPYKCHYAEQSSGRKYGYKRPLPPLVNFNTILESVDT